MIDVGAARFFDRCPRCTGAVLARQPYPVLEELAYVEPWAERVAEVLAAAEGRWAA